LYQSGNPCLPTETGGGVVNKIWLREEGSRNLGATPGVTCEERGVVEDKFSLRRNSSQLEYKIGESVPVGTMAGASGKLSAFDIVPIFFAIVGCLLVGPACDFEVRAGAKEALCGRARVSPMKYDKALQMRSALLTDFFAIHEVLDVEGIEPSYVLVGVVVDGETPSRNLLADIMSH